MSAWNSRPGIPWLWPRSIALPQQRQRCHPIRWRQSRLVPRRPVSRQPGSGLSSASSKAARGNNGYHFAAPSRSVNTGNSAPVASMRECEPLKLPARRSFWISLPLKIAGRISPFPRQPSWLCYGPDREWGTRRLGNCRPCNRCRWYTWFCHQAWPRSGCWSYCNRCVG